MRLAHDQTPSVVFGVDIMTVGLPCRGGCHRRFVPATMNSAEDLAVSVAERDAHELGEHGYRHVIERTPETWAFTKGFSRRGRSTLGRRARA